MINFMKMTQGNFEEIKKSQDAERKNNEALRKMLEKQIGQMAKQIAEQNKGGCYLIEEQKGFNTFSSKES